MKCSSLPILLFGMVLGITIGVNFPPLAAAESQDRVAIWLEVVHRVATSIGGLGTLVANPSLHRAMR